MTGLTRGLLLLALIVMPRFGHKGGGGRERGQDESTGGKGCPECGSPVTPVDGSDKAYCGAEAPHRLKRDAKGVWHKA